MGLAGGDPSSTFGMKALFSSSEVLTRRVEFVPALRADAHSSIPMGLVPLNSYIPPLGVGKAKDLTDQNAERKESSKGASTSVDADIQLTWTAARKVGAGLVNLGNTCFLNSVLQCLTYTPPLVHYLESGQHRASCRNAGFCALCTLEAHVKRALSSTGGAVAPNALVKNLRTISRSFRIGRQEDAHEFARYLIEALQKCCVGPIPGNKPDPQKEAKSFIQRAFGGRLRSQVRCLSCQHCSNTFDPFLDLSLEISRADSLLKALQRFTMPETLDGDNRYKCSRCKKKVRAVKQFTIDKPPPVLTIQLKRFDHSGGFGGKLDKRVDFGATLDLGPFLSSSHTPGGKTPPQKGGCSYELYGVLVHAGRSTHSGHYYCFVRTATGMWHAMDDSRVRQVSERTVLEQRAYMLFFIRKAAPQTHPKASTAAPISTQQKAENGTPNLTPKSQTVAPKQPNDKPEPLKGAGEAEKAGAAVEVPKGGPPKSTEKVEKTNQAAKPLEVSRTESDAGEVPSVVPLKSTGKAERASQAVEALEVQKRTEKAAESEEDTRNSKEEAFAREEEEEEHREVSSGGGSIWDEYYRDQWGLVSPAYHRLLRTMPSTRRYFLARRMHAFCSYVRVLEARRTREQEETSSEEATPKPEKRRLRDEEATPEAEVGVKRTLREEEATPKAEVGLGEGMRRLREEKATRAEEADKEDVKREPFRVLASSRSQFGARVPRWDEDAKDSVGAVEPESRTPKRRYDEWDMAYDQGRRKKVRSKAFEDAILSNPPANGGSGNAFQAVLNEKAAQKQAEREGQIEKRVVKRARALREGERVRSQEEF